MNPDIQQPVKWLIKLKIVYSKGKAVWPVLFIFFAVWAVYCNTLDNQFTNWDDDNLIVANEQIRSLSFKNIAAIFDLNARGTYQPVRVLSYAVDYHFWGLNPVGYHIQNIVLHGLASIMLYLGLLHIIPGIRGMRMAGPAAVQSAAVQSAALLTAFVFAVHPLGTEAVTWLSGRKYVLLSFFSFFSLYLFAKCITSKAGNIYLLAGSVSAAVLAALSSPVGIVFPLIVLVCIYAMDQSSNPVSVLLKHRKNWLPYCVVFIPVFVKLWTTLVRTNPFGGGASTAHFEGDPFNTLWTMIRVVFDYVRNIFFPFWLNIRYPDWVSRSFMEYKVITAIILSIAAAVLIVSQVRKQDKRFFFCAAWFVVFWLPVSNIVPISTKMADRYIYMAFPGLILLVSLYVVPLLNTTACNKKIPFFVFTAIAVFLTACYYGPVTIQRNRTWKDSGTLWKASLRAYPGNAIAHNNLGVHLLYAENSPQKAEKHFRAAARLKPESPKPYENLYHAYFKQGDYEKAARCGKKLVLFQPENARWYIMTGTAFEKLGIQGQERAEHFFHKAVEKDPLSIEAANNLASLLITGKKYAQAEAVLNKVLSAGKTDANLFFNLGVAASLQKDPEQAAGYFLKVIDIQPEDAVSHFLAGQALLKLGDRKKGTMYVKKARQLDPDNRKFY